MKKCSKKLTVWLLGLALVLTLCGCGGSSKESAVTSEMADSAPMEQAWDTNGLYSTGAITDEYASEEAVEEDYAEEPMEESAASGDGGSEDLGNTVASNRKLIRRVNLNVETQDFPGLTQFIENKVNELGGYMETSNISGGSYEYDTRRTAQYTVRVPVDKLDALVGAVAEQGNVTNKNESATDVTLTYVDTKSRKEAYEVEYERLMALLEKAEDIDTIVALESRLTSVRYEIQGLESQLRTYDNLVDYATIDISIREVVVYTPVEPEKKTDFERMTEGFVNSLQNIAYDIKEFAIDFVIDLPYLVLWAIIIGIIVLIVRKIRKRRKMKKEKKNAEGKENGVRDTDRKTECGEINTDEPVDRTEDSDNLK
ncbi:MAG: DUF4349 domain-containing protein [Lachnospiraceae bacterium]|nr:DUF4349 domain-containing protein [Lachnospiraceae bacterium]